MAFCGVSYFEIVGSRTYQIPTKADFLASLFPLICIPAVLSLGAGLFKWYVLFIYKVLISLDKICFLKMIGDFLPRVILSVPFSGKTTIGSSLEVLICS